MRMPSVMTTEARIATRFMPDVLIASGRAASPSSARIAKTASTMSAPSRQRTIATCNFGMLKRLGCDIAIQKAI